MFVAHPISSSSLFCPFGFFTMFLISHMLCKSEGKTGTKKSNRSKKALNFEKLGSHTSEFNNPRVISICENKIHVAIGTIFGCDAACWHRWIPAIYAQET